MLHFRRIQKEGLCYKINEGLANFLVELGYLLGKNVEYRNCHVSAESERSRRQTLNKDKTFCFASLFTHSCDNDDVDGDNGNTSAWSWNSKNSSLEHGYFTLR